MARPAPIASLDAVAGSGVAIERNGTPLEEELTLSPRLFDALATAVVGQAVEVRDWPAGPALRRSVRLERVEIYAPEARVYVVEAAGPREVPRSSWRFFSGAIDGGRVAVALDPERREVRGFAAIGGRSFEMEPAIPAAGDAGPSARRREPAVRVAAVEWNDERRGFDRRRQWTCGGDSLEQERPPRPRPDFLPARPRSRAAARWDAVLPAATEGLSSADSIRGNAERVRAAGDLVILRTATIAVDTDNELLWNKYQNDTTAAANEIAALFVALNVIYERDVNVRLLQGTTFLRPSTTPDPYVQPCGAGTTSCGNGGSASAAQLNEVIGYWNSGCGATCSGVSRAAVMMLSGKQASTSQSSGIAYVEELCESLGYSFTQVFRHPSNPLTSTLFVLAHELGHNFGALHTHCRWIDPNPAPPHPPPFIDTCSTAASGGSVECHSGSISCPASAIYQGVTTRGTLMSYCHLIGCLDEDVFHARSLDEYIDPHVDSKVGICVLPLFQVAAVDPPSGPTAGGAPVTIRGAGFTLDGTVDGVFFDGNVPAASFSVDDDSTISAVTPAHATGTVGVRLTKAGGPPSGSEEVLTQAYFYADPSAGSDFNPLTPCRMVDTRGGAPIGGGAFAALEERLWTLAAATPICGVPDTAIALSVNVTVTGPTAVGQIEVYPGNAFPLRTTTLAFAAGQTRANNAVFRLETTGQGSVRVKNQSWGTVHVIVDVNGYFE